MSYYRLPLMIRWVVETDQKNIEKFLQMSMSERLESKEFKNLVKQLKTQWEDGTKIQRLATFGWVDEESEHFMSNILENLDQIRAEYMEQVKLNGPPMDFSDENLELFEKAVKECKN
jgi:hypothetical protein